MSCICATQPGAIKDQILIRLACHSRRPGLNKVRQRGWIKTNFENFFFFICFQKVTLAVSKVSHLPHLPPLRYGHACSMIGKRAVMYMCIRGINFTSVSTIFWLDNGRGIDFVCFYNFAIGFWICPNTHSVLFLFFHFFICNHKIFKTKRKPTHL